MAEEKSIAKNISEIAGKMIKSILPSGKSENEDEASNKNDTNDRAVAVDNDNQAINPTNEPNDALKSNNVDAKRQSSSNKSSYQILQEIVNQSVIFKNKIKNLEKFFYEREQSLEDIEDQSFTKRIKNLLSKTRLVEEKETETKKSDKSGLLNFLGFVAFAFLPVIMKFLQSVTSFKDLFTDVAQKLAKFITDTVSSAFNIVLAALINKAREELEIQNVEAFVKNNLPKTISELILDKDGFIKGLAPTTPTPESTKLETPTGDAVPFPEQPSKPAAEKMPEIDSTLKRIGGAESAGSYNIAYGETAKTAGKSAREFSGGKELSEMSFEEVSKFQSSLPKAKTAIGKYQFIQPTLFGTAKAPGGLVKAAGLSMQDKFSPENQEKLAKALMAENDKVLQAKGIPLTDGNRYMAWYIGANATVAVNKAAAEGKDITVSQAVKAATNMDPTAGGKVNLELNKIKVADFEAHLENKMPGGSQRQLSEFVPPKQTKGALLEKESTTSAAEEEAAGRPAAPQVIVQPGKSGKESSDVAFNNKPQSNPIDTQGVQNLYLTRLAMA